MPDSGGQHLKHRAFAKINLALGVGSPLPAGTPHAGFHPIASWMAAIDLADEVEVEPLPAGSASRYEVSWAPDAPRPSPIDWPVERDLAVRAHRAVEAALGTALPVNLRVRKRIPVGGGLGGGSSDAAAALLAVNAACNARLSMGELRAIGATLGSDVLFFLDEASGPDQPPRAAIVGGLGNRIDRPVWPIPIRGPITLAIPPFGCQTGPVYAAFDRGRGDRASRGVDEPGVRRLVEHARATGNVDGVLFNDLADAACDVEPRLRRLIDDLANASGRAWHVTGSGSCLFTLGDAGDAAGVANRAGAVLHSTRLLPDAPTLRGSRVVVTI